MPALHPKATFAAYYQPIYPAGLRPAGYTQQALLEPRAEAKAFGFDL